MDYKDLQVENGNFTRIINPLLEALVAIPFKGCELAVAIFIIRKTYGFQKKEDEISLTQFCKGLKRSRTTIVKALKNLQLVKAVELVKRGNSKNSSNVWKINKYMDKWELVKAVELVKAPIKQLVKAPIHTKERIKETNTREMNKLEYQPINDEGEEVTKYKGLKNPVTSRGEFNYEKELEKLRTSPKITDNIAALFFFHRELKFRNWAQYYPYLARTIHTAKLLKGYSGKEIDKVIEYCKKKWPEEWTLETCVKWIAEVNK